MTADTVDTNAGSGEEAVPTSMFMAIVQEIFYSPMNLALVAIIAFLVYKIIKDRIEVPSVGSQKPPEPELPKLRRDFTVAELRQFDGTQPDGRVLVAVNGNVFDVTRGKRFYGPGKLNTVRIFIIVLYLILLKLQFFCIKNFCTCMYT